MPKFLSTTGTSLMMKAVMIRMLMEKPTSIKELVTGSGMHAQTVKNTLRALHSQKIIEVTSDPSGAIQYQLRVVSGVPDENP